MGFCFAYCPLMVARLMCSSSPAPRKLGVTTEMLLWLTNVLQNEGAEKRLGIAELRLKENRVVLEAALKMGFFFLCGAGEYVKSGAPDFEKIMRGVDAKRRRGPSSRYRLDVLFRKTETDQLAFGCTRSHYPGADGARGLGVVDAVARLQRAFPERIDGPEQEKPLFRWKNGALVRREDLQ